MEEGNGRNVRKLFLVPIFSRNGLFVNCMQFFRQIYLMHSGDEWARTLRMKLKSEYGELRE